jgi:hypothetical protein
LIIAAIFPISKSGLKTTGGIAIFKQNSKKFTPIKLPKTIHPPQI